MIRRFCTGKKPISPGHEGDTAFLPGQKTQVTTLGALGGLAFDFAYDINKANLSERKMYDKQIMIWQFSYYTPYQPETPISAQGPEQVENESMCILDDSYAWDRMVHLAFHFVVRRGTKEPRRWTVALWHFTGKDARGKA